MLSPAGPTPGLQQDGAITFARRSAHRQATPDRDRPRPPETRSGKIMRHLLRDVPEGREVGDIQTLADASILDIIAVGHSTP